MSDRVSPDMQWTLGLIAFWFLHVSSGVSRLSSSKLFSALKKCFIIIQALHPTNHPNSSGPESLLQEVPAALLAGLPHARAYTMAEMSFSAPSSFFLFSSRLSLSHPPSSYGERGQYFKVVKGSGSWGAGVPSPAT